MEELQSKKSLRVALIINPVAGLGGSVALKGSDGVSEKALELGAKKRSSDRALMALQDFGECFQLIEWFTPGAPMGAQVLKELGLPFKLLPVQIKESTTAEHTASCVNAALDLNVDLILFAGGDGTARDICSVVGDRVPVLGIPAGVKIHSGVYAVTPHAAGEILAAMVSGELVDIKQQEVRDIDETAFRNNSVKSKYFGEMQVPSKGEFLQHTKDGSGKEVEDLTFSEISDFIIDHMEPEVVYLIGSGKSTSYIMEGLGLQNTLLGIDAVLDKTLLMSDLKEEDILMLAEQYRIKVVISVIGGQGHLFGRGNQQLSAEVIRKIGIKNFQPIASKTKLKNLEGRPLIADTGDRDLDLSLSRNWKILTGYDDFVLYPVITR